MFIGYLLVVVLACIQSSASASQAIVQFERETKTKKSMCERVTCQSLPADENMNCVNECTSPKCFKQVYGEEPLEDGEIDTKRAREFNQCVRLEIVDKKKELLKARKSKS